MIVERSTSPEWLSNSYLVADRPGGAAVVIDTGAPMEPLVAAVERLGLTVEQVLCTHGHPDHVQHNEAWRQHYGCTIAGPAVERAAIGRLDVELSGGESIEVGGLVLTALLVPGHTPGHLAFHAAQAGAVFTGDVLFRRSVGGSRGGGPTGFEDLRRSVLEVLLGLPPETMVWPGHATETTIGEERAENPFVRAWLGLNATVERPCVALGRPATLLLRAPDYDGGTKCWVRFDEDGRLDVVPGSAVHDR